MQIPENPGNKDLSEAVLKLSEEVQELARKIERLDANLDAYRKGNNGMGRVAMTMIITTASIVAIASLGVVATAIIATLSTANGW